MQLAENALDLTSRSCHGPQPKAEALLRHEVARGGYERTGSGLALSRRMRESKPRRGEINWSQGQRPWRIGQIGLRPAASPGALPRAREIAPLRGSRSQAPAITTEPVLG
jgi:hypothetical protein